MQKTQKNKQFWDFFRHFQSALWIEIKIVKNLNWSFGSEISVSLHLIQDPYPFKELQINIFVSNIYDLTFMIYNFIAFLFLFLLLLFFVVWFIFPSLAFAHFFCLLDPRPKEGPIKSPLFFRGSVHPSLSVRRLSQEWLISLFWSLARW